MQAPRETCFAGHPSQFWNVTDEIHPLPITGELDLHTFKPRDVGSLVPEYLSECQARGILTVRIIHGKGTGTLRRAVRAMLDRHPLVTSYETAARQEGGEGVTVAYLAGVQ